MEDEHIDIVGDDTPILTIQPQNLSKSQNQTPISEIETQPATTNHTQGSTQPSSFTQADEKLEADKFLVDPSTNKINGDKADKDTIKIDWRRHLRPETEEEKRANKIREVAARKGIRPTQNLIVSFGLESFLKKTLSKGKKAEAEPTIASKIKDLEGPVDLRPDNYLHNLARAPPMTFAPITSLQNKFKSKTFDLSMDKMPEYNKFLLAPKRNDPALKALDSTDLPKPLIKIRMPKREAPQETNEESTNQEPGTSIHERDVEIEEEDVDTSERKHKKKKKKRKHDREHDDDDDEKKKKKKKKKKSKSDRHYETDEE